jgi:serine/threonine-protein kinase
MTSDRWQQVKVVLDEVLQCSPEEQPARLDALCGADAALRAEVEALLEAEADAPAFLDEGAGALGLHLFEGGAVQGAIGPADRVGPYRLFEKIGVGGMGVVYRAERADGHFEQEVAVKVMPRYFETAEREARFRAERQILASLSHPNIARLLDGGVTGAGHPYLVMECVEGQPITAYCAERALPLRERLRLLQTVGRAVHHAHKNLVVHRDLKPSNILVTEAGTVKLLDFGIAKLLNPETAPAPPPTTRAGRFLMTPAYAAPEQVRGEDVTTDTDVYQLGVLAYELLTETRPYRVDSRRLSEIERAVLETRPTRPSRAVSQAGSNHEAKVPHSRAEWSRRLRGDLDDVVMTALRKEPERRYASAKALVDDLDRVLTNRPIRARPATLAYRVRKVIQRNRGVVLTSFVGVLLLAGITVVYTLQIQGERDRARAEAQKSEEVTSFLMDLFEASAPTEALGDTITARTLLNRGLERANALQDQPEIQAQMFDVVGQIHGRLGRYEESEAVLRRAVQVRTRVHGRRAPETVESREHLGVFLGDGGHYEAAERILRDVLDLRETVLRDDALSIADTKRRLAYVLRRQGEYKDAQHLLEQALAAVESRVGGQDEQTISIKSTLGVVLQNRGRYDAAESLYREVLEARRRQYEPPHPKLAMSTNSLASLLMNVGLLDEAEFLFQEALSMREDLFGPDHPKVALTLNNLGLVHRAQGDYEEAEAFFRRALSIRRTRLGDEHLSVAISLFSLADLLHRTDRPRPALSAYRTAHDLFREHLGSDHSFTARTRMGIGSVYHKLGRRERAATALHDGFERVRRIHADSSLEYALAAGRLGRFYLENGNASRAEPLLKRGLAGLKGIEKTTTPRQRVLERALARLSSEGTGGANSE